MQALSRSLSDPSSAPPPSEPAADGAKKAWSGGAIAAAALLIWKFKAVGVFLLTKGKLLLFGLSKGTTFFSMLAALGVYWTIWGWKFALGFVLSIYIHEMGHVAAMKRFGLAATAPMFIPGFGAFIRMKQHPATVQEEARIGLGGPDLGLRGGGRLLPALPGDRAALLGGAHPHRRDDQPVQPAAGLAARRRPRVQGAEPHRALDRDGRRPARRCS